MSELHDLTGSYVVDALTEPERRAFENHLVDCAACRQEVAELRATSALLAVTTPHEPPAQLRELIMSRTAAMPQRWPAPPARIRSATWLVAAAAALLLALVGGGYWATGLSRTNDRLAAQASVMNAVLSAPDVQATSADVATGGQATIVSSRTRATAVFVASGLSRPDAAHVYELWWITASGKALPAGTFAPASDGSAFASMQVGAGSGTVGLTVEPAGGSQQPTTKPVVLVPIKS